MALPSIFIPSKINGYITVSSQAVELLDPFASVDRTRGHGRKRRLFTMAERNFDVQTKPMEISFATIFEDWYENVLLAGARSFSVLLGNQGVGQVWWEAYWLEQPKYEPTHGRITITGRLRLVGASTATSPATGAAAVEFGAPFISIVGARAVNPNAAVEFGAALLVFATSKVEFGAAFIHVNLTPTYLLREAGGFRLREGGGDRRRESTDA